VACDARRRGSEEEEEEEEEWSVPSVETAKV
jgi:hypothetical protein